MVNLIFDVKILNRVFQQVFNFLNEFPIFLNIVCFVVVQLRCSFVVTYKLNIPANSSLILNTSSVTYKMCPHRCLSENNLMT